MWESALTGKATVVRRKHLSRLPIKALCGTATSSRWKYKWILIERCTHCEVTYHDKSVMFVDSWACTGENQLQRDTTMPNQHNGDMWHFFSDVWHQDILRLFFLWHCLPEEVIHEYLIVQILTMIHILIILGKGNIVYNSKLQFLVIIINLLLISPSIAQHPTILSFPLSSSFMIYTLLIFKCTSKKKKSQWMARELTTDR